MRPLLFAIILLMGSDALAEITTVSITGEPRIAQTLWFDFKGTAEKDQYIVVDYGDGVSNQNKVSQTGGNWAVDWFHSYTRPGSYTVVVTEKNLAGEVIDRDTAFLTIDTSPISTGLIGGIWEVYEYRNVEGGRQPMSGMSMQFYGDGIFTFVGPSEGFGAYASGAYRKELTDFLLVRDGIGYPGNDKIFYDEGAEFMALGVWYDTYFFKRSLASVTNRSASELRISYNHTRKTIILAGLRSTSEIEMYDLHGKKITSSIRVGQEEDGLQVHCPSLTPGLYVVRVLSASREEQHNVMILP